MKLIILLFTILLTSSVSADKACKFVKERQGCNKRSYCSFHDGKCVDFSCNVYNEKMCNLKSKCVWNGNICIDPLDMFSCESVTTQRVCKRTNCLWQKGKCKTFSCSVMTGKKKCKKNRKCSWNKDSNNCTNFSCEFESKRNRRCRKKKRKHKTMPPTFYPS